MVTHQFSVNLVHDGNVISQLNMQQFHKHNFQCDETADLTVGDNLLHFFTQLGDLPQTGLLFFKKVRGDH